MSPLGFPGRFQDGRDVIVLIVNPCSSEQGVAQVDLEDDTINMTHTSVRLTVFIPWRL